MKCNAARMAGHGNRSRAALASNATSYTDSGVDDGTSYSYQVRGLNINGNSDFSTSADTTTPVLAPTNVTTTSVSTTQIDLSWTNPSATATSFQICRAMPAKATRRSTPFREPLIPTIRSCRRSDGFV